MKKDEEKYGQMTFKGKVTRVDSTGDGNEKRYFHEMVIPGRDEWDNTSGIVIVSKRMIGAEGDVKEVTVAYNGFIKVIRYVDKKTGEQNKFRQLNSRFTEVEIVN